jgi:hypothetical protein
MPEKNLFIYLLKGSRGASRQGHSPRGSHKGAVAGGQSPGHSGMSSNKQPDIIFFAIFFRPKYQF